MPDRFGMQALKLFAVFMMTLVIAGCGGPYYTIDGPMEAKQLVVHDGEKEIKVDLATGMGGGLTGDAVDLDGSFVVEQDDIKVIGEVDPTRRVKVSEVRYKGEKIGLGSLGADI